jgi:REP element-mobilizing transposase RayT
VPRKQRGPVPAGVYHVWRRAAGPIEMFRNDLDRTMFCNRLSGTITKYSWTLIAFVLMPTHFHLVVDVEDDVLQPGMRDAFGPYAQWFNRQHGRWGHLKGDPYGLRRIVDDADLANAVRYVFRNPVRDGLCERPQDWLWSSYRATAGYAKPFPFVDDPFFVTFFHEEREKAIPQLRVFVEAD